MLELLQNWIKFEFEFGSIRNEMSSLRNLRFHLYLLLVQVLFILIAFDVTHYHGSHVEEPFFPRPRKDYNDDSFHTHELLMRCPPGWQLHIVMNATTRTFDHQACFAKSSAEWICADGWERIQGSSRLCGRSDHKTGGFTTTTRHVFTNISRAGGAMNQSFVFDVRDGRLNDSGNLYLDGNMKIAGDWQSSRFTMIRHPCTRLIEYWKRHVINSRETEVSVLDKRFIASFNTFVEDAFINANKSESFLPPQVDEIFQNDGLNQFHQVLVSERLNESLEYLRETFGEKGSLLQTSNSPKLDENVTCQKVYTSNSWEILRRMYSVDFCVLGYSENIGKTNIAPPVNLTKTKMTDRYERCKENATIVQTIPADDVANYEVTRVKTNNRSCLIFAYYDDYQDKTKRNYQENRLVDLWKEKWASAGWEPHVISVKEAQRHSDFSYLVEKFKSFPTVNHKDYELSCFMRYLAMAVVGGGWMSDYDVLPYDIPKCMAPFKNDTFTVYGGFVPALLHGASSEYTRVARLMANIDSESSANFSVKNSSHVSDMLCILKLTEKGLIHSEWILVPAERIFSVPFSCKNFRSTKSYSKFVRKKDGHVNPFAIHYSHRSFRDTKAFIVSRDWNVDMNKRSVITRKMHEFYVKECKHGSDHFGDTAVSNETTRTGE